MSHLRMRTGGGLRRQGLNRRPPPALVLSPIRYRSAVHKGKAPPAVLAEVRAKLRALPDL